MNKEAIFHIRKRPCGRKAWLKSLLTCLFDTHYWKKWDKVEFKQNNIVVSLEFWECVDCGTKDFYVMREIKFDGIGDSP